MPGPKNSFNVAGDFRAYRWEPAGGGEPTDVLSVTSIRKLCGESFMLVAWQINNVVNVAMGTTKKEVIGPRGGVKSVYVKDGDFPGAFVTNLLATNGEQGGLDRVRAWLRNAADQPRDTAAARGTIVHEAIELNVLASQIDQDYMEAAVGRLSAKDQKKMATGVTVEDTHFVYDCMRNYWDMREYVPFVILERELQVWNLTAGYAGSADALLWFLGHFEEDGTWIALEGMDNTTLHRLQHLADAGKITQTVIDKIGGHVTLGDWKTSKNVYSDQVVQVHAYLAAEFVGSDGVIDTRLTEILNAADKAALLHIRPDGWNVHFVDFREPVLLAFLGSVAFARFLARYPEPDELFTHDVTGKAVIE